jgi:hypothetical protein
MSNLTYIRTKLTNRDYLVTALKNLGYIVVEGSGLFISNSYRKQAVDFICKDSSRNREFGFFLSDSSDYSIVESKERSLGLNVSALENEIMKIENQVKREYARQIVKSKLAAHGFILEEEKEIDETVIIKLSRII